MIILVLLVALVCLVYWYLRQRNRLFERLGIPGPKPAILFGNAGDFANKFPLDVFHEWTLKYGKVYGFYEGLVPSVVISDPDLTQQILVKKFNFFHQRAHSSPFLHATDELSIQNCHGDLWKRQRTVVTKAFRTPCLRQILPDMVAVSERLLARLKKLEPELESGLNISDLCDRYTLDAFSTSAFGYRSDAINDSQEILLRYMQAFNNSYSATNPLTGIARLFPSMAPLLKLFDKTHRDLHTLHLEVVRTLIEKEKQNILQSPDGQSANLLRRLIEGYTVSVDEDNNSMRTHLSDEEVLAQAASLVGGGLGPAHSVLSFALYLLATNQNAQSKLRDEILSVVGMNDSLSVESLNQLQYLDMILEETMRVFPVIPGVSRTCTEDCEVEGVRFTEGMTVRVMAVSMYKDEKYFPEPEQFRPERFSREERKKRPLYSYLPFGHGPRMCVGLKFGLAQIKVAIVQLLRHYVITSSDKTEIPLKTRLHPFLCPKNGVHVTLLRRECNKQERHRSCRNRSVIFG